jgi:hypothetical protein
MPWHNPLHNKQGGHNDSNLYLASSYMRLVNWQCVRFNWLNVFVSGVCQCSNDVRMNVNYYDRKAIYIYIYCNVNYITVKYRNMYINYILYERKTPVTKYIHIIHKA